MSISKITVQKYWTGDKEPEEFGVEVDIRLPKDGGEVNAKVHGFKTADEAYRAASDLASSMESWRVEVVG